MPGTEADVTVVVSNQLKPFVAASAASYNDLAAPNSIVAGFGSQLATGVAIADSLPLPTSLGGVRVTVRDSLGVSREAPLFFVSPNQINYLVPAETALGLATVNVIAPVPGTARGFLNVDRDAPGLFAANANGQGIAAAIALRVKADGSLVNESVAQFDAAQNRFLPLAIDLSAANEQVFLVLFGTGFRGRTELAEVQARIGGLPVEVLYAGAQSDFAGLDQINLRLPRELAGRGDLDIIVTADGFAANTVQIRVR